MKLLTHNFLQSHIKGVKNGYPLKIEPAKVEERDADYDPGVRRMWVLLPAWRRACVPENEQQLPPTPHAVTHCTHTAPHADFLRSMFKRVDWQAFVQGAHAVRRALDSAVLSRRCAVTAVCCHGGVLSRRCAAAAATAPCATQLAAHTRLRLCVCPSTPCRWAVLRACPRRWARSSCRTMPSCRGSTTRCWRWAGAAGGGCLHGQAAGGVSTPPVVAWGQLPRSVRHAPSPALVLAPPLCHAGVPRGGRARVSRDGAALPRGEWHTKHAAQRRRGVTL
jgi:hypothetical protein